MTSERLVLKDREFFGAKSIRIVADINGTFHLGIDRNLGALNDNIHVVLSALRNPTIGDADSLLRIALSRQAAKASRQQHISIPTVDAWHRIGLPDIAKIFEECYALANDVKIKIQYRGTEDEHPVVANAAAINAECRKLDQKLGPLVEVLEFTPDDISGIASDIFELDLRPDHQFRDCWIDRILNSSGFDDYAPALDRDGLPHFEPFGSVTKHHVSALKTHGYVYKFAFWEEPVGDTRGHLWVQTDKGPLVLSDKTDSTSLRTTFPVQVSNLKRRKMFKLRKRDLDKKASGGNALLRWFGSR